MILISFELLPLDLYEVDNPYPVLPWPSLYMWICKSSYVSGTRDGYIFAVPLVKRYPFKLFQ